MDLKLRCDLSRQLGDPNVLHDDRIRARLGDRGQASGRFGQLMIEDQGVEGNVALDPALMQGAHHVRQFGQREADLGAGGEVLQAKIDRVRAGFDRGLQLRPIAGWAHNFRFSRVNGAGR